MAAAKNAGEWAHLLNTKMSLREDTKGLKLKTDHQE